MPATGPVWPTPEPTGSVDTDDIVEKVTERVLSRLSDSVVLREMVSEIVSKVADRLIREEIERIKESVK